MVHISFGQIVDYEWSLDIGDTAYCRASKNIIDHNQDQIITGIFSGSVDFDPGPGTSILTSSALFDRYILKLDAQGDFIWAIRMETEYLYDLIVDESNNIFATGIFINPLDADPGPGVFNLNSVGASDAFILKLDSNGNFVHAISFGGILQEESNSITIDDNDNVYVTGWFESQIDFNAGFNAITIVPEDLKDGFVVKYDNDLIFDWVLQIPGQDDEAIDAHITYNDGFLYTSGGFESTADIDPTAGVQSVVAAGARDYYTIKLNTSGLFVWGNTVNSTLGLTTRSITCDHSGNIITMGNILGSADFDPSPGVLDLFGSSSATDVFIQKLDPNGNLLWAKVYGGVTSDISYIATVDEYNSIYVSGSFAGSADFDPGPGSNQLYTNGGSTNAYLNILDSNGIFVQACQFESSFDSFGHSHAIDENNNVYVTGHFQEDIDADPGIDTVLHVAPSTINMFVVKLGDCQVVLHDVVTSCGSYEWIDGNTYLTNNSTAEFLIIDSIGCDSLIVLDLTIIDNDETIISNNGILTSNQSNAIYQWIDCDDSFSPISGETNISFMPNVDGNYAVIVSQNGCADTSECITVDYLGTYSLHFKDVNVFPNPTTEGVTIAVASGFGPYTIEILHTTGVVIEYIEQKNGEHTVQLPEKAGLYFIRINFDSGLKKIAMIRKI